MHAALDELQTQPLAHCSGAAPGASGAHTAADRSVAELSTKPGPHRSVEKSRKSASTAQGAEPMLPLRAL